jgi:hypothetical protein
MIDALEWSGKEEFAAVPLQDWSPGILSHRAGQTKSYGGLTWSVISVFSLSAGSQLFLLTIGRDENVGLRLRELLI